MNRTERRWKAGKRGRKALAAALAAGLLALSPLAGMEAHAASTDDLIIYGGGGGGGSCGNAPGGGGGGYVRYGDLVQFAGGGLGSSANQYSSAGSISGAAGSSNGGGVGPIEGGSGLNNPRYVGLGDGGKVPNASGNTPAAPVADSITDLSTIVTPGGNADQSYKGGDGGSAAVFLSGPLELGSLILFGGNEGGTFGMGTRPPGGAGGSARFDANSQTVTLNGSLTVVSGSPGANSNAFAGNASLTIGTLVAAGSGTYTFGEPAGGGTLIAAISALELEADVTMQFTGNASYNTLFSGSLQDYTFNGGTLTVEDDVSLDAKNITLASVSSGSSSQTLIQSTSGNLTGVVNVSTSLTNLTEWQVVHSGGTASFAATTTSIDLRSLTNVTAIRAVMDLPVAPPNPGPSGGDSSTGGLASTGDANTALIVGVAALIAVAGVGLCVYGLKRRSQINKS